MGQELGEDLVDPTTPATVLRGTILLAALTENENLPADPDYRIRVSWTVCPQDRYLCLHFAYPSSTGTLFPRVRYLYWGSIHVTGLSTSFSHKSSRTS